MAKKIEEATPPTLPQTPVANKLKSDAEDENLKGKVKSVIEEFQEPGEKTRERNSEDYYNETGNYIRTISYSEGYPMSVAAWGYIDGKRVSKSNFIKYNEGERPPSDVIVASAENNVKNPNASRDARYSVSHEYKYNAQEQLVEKMVYANNGELWSRKVYNYKANQRENLDYGADGSRWGQAIEILDKDGNVIEQHSLDENGKIDEKETFTYEYDAKGNWIVKKVFENKKVKGKWIPKLWYTAYRTITYYE